MTSGSIYNLHKIISKKGSRYFYASTPGKGVTLANLLSQYLEQGHPQDYLHFIGWMRNHTDLRLMGFSMTSDLGMKAGDVLVMPF